MNSCSLTTKSSSVHYLNTTSDDDSNIHKHTHKKPDQWLNKSLEKVGKASTFQVPGELYLLLFEGERELFYILLSLQPFHKGGEQALLLSQYLQSKICPFIALYLCAAQSPSQQLWKASKYYSPYCKHKETMLKWDTRPPREPVTSWVLGHLNFSLKHLRNNPESYVMPFINALVSHYELSH